MTPPLTGAEDREHSPRERETREEGECILGCWQGGQRRGNVTMKAEQQATPPALLGTQ